MELLNVKQEISFLDFVVGLTIVIEFFQYAAIGPDHKSISIFLDKISNGLSLDLGSFIKLDNGVFWIITDIVLLLSLLWVILCIVVLFRLDELFSRFIIFKYLSQMSDYLMPILGNLCFIPFISILLDNFVCDESIGNDFSDSFLAKDCYQFCWTGYHNVYAILSGIALLSYQPLAVFCRPL